MKLAEKTREFINDLPRDNNGFSASPMRRRRIRLVFIGLSTALR